MASKSRAVREAGLLDKDVYAGVVPCTRIPCLYGFSFSNHRHVGHLYCIVFLPIRYCARRKEMLWFAILLCDTALANLLLLSDCNDSAVSLRGCGRTLHGLPPALAVTSFPKPHVCQKWGVGFQSIPLVINPSSRVMITLLHILDAPCLLALGRPNTPLARGQNTTGRSVVENG